MGTNEKLENLFERWIQRSKENNENNGNVNFTKDGLMEKNDPKFSVENVWQNATKRVLFLLKDQPADFCDDARFWLKETPQDEEKHRKNKAKNRELSNKFLHNLANIFYGLHHSTPQKPLWHEDLDFEAVKNFFNTAPFAFVECKKQGGEAEISNKTLRTYLEKYGDLLREEIEILNPNMIVCTNSEIYGFVLKNYPENELRKLEKHNSIRFHEKTKTFIFCSYHPSAIMNYEKFYDGVMSHFNAYLIWKRILKISC